MPRTKQPKSDTTSPSRYQAAQDVCGKQAILLAILEAKGDKSVAAELLGISRMTLYREIDRLGLEDEIKKVAPRPAG